MRAWIRHQFRRKTRVYIMPTKMGAYIIALLFLMFLLSVGYSNNLLLVFTLLLFAFNLLWLVQSHFHLHRLRFGEITLRPGHEGEENVATIIWTKTPTGPTDWSLRIEGEEELLSLAVASTQGLVSHVIFKNPRRGSNRFRYLRVATDRPFGLYKTWIYFKVDKELICYPKLKRLTTINPQDSGLEGELRSDARGLDDFRGLSPYSQDEARRISWKHYARSGELLVKEGDELKTSVLDIIVRLPVDSALKEDYLSEIATRMVHCQRRQIPFSFSYPGATFTASTGAKHLDDCLKVLAVC